MIVAILRVWTLLFFIMCLMFFFLPQQSTWGRSWSLAYQQNLMVEAIINCQSAFEFQQKITQIMKAFDSFDDSRRDLFIRPIENDKSPMNGLVIIELIFNATQYQGFLFKFSYLRKYGVFNTSPDPILGKQTVRLLWRQICTLALNDEDLSRFFQMVFSPASAGYEGQKNFQEELLSMIEPSDIFLMLKHGKIKATLGLIDALYEFDPLLVAVGVDGPFLGKQHFSLSLPLMEAVVQEMARVSKTEDFYFECLSIFRDNLLKIWHIYFFKFMGEAESMHLFRAILSWDFGSEGQRKEFESLGMLKKLLAYDDPEKSLTKKSIQNGELQFFFMIIKSLSAEQLDNTPLAESLLHQAVFFAGQYEKKGDVSPFLVYLLSNNNPKNKFFMRWVNHCRDLDCSPIKLAKKIGFTHCESYLREMSNTFNPLQRVFLHSNAPPDDYLIDFTTSYCLQHLPNAGWYEANGLQESWEDLLREKFRSYHSCVQHYTAAYSSSRSLENQNRFYKPFFQALVEVLKECQPSLLYDVDFLYQLTCSDYMLEFGRYHELAIKELLSRAFTPA